MGVIPGWRGHLLVRLGPVGGILGSLSRRFVIRLPPRIPHRLLEGIAQRLHPLSRNGGHPLPLANGMDTRHGEVIGGHGRHPRNAAIIQRIPPSGNPKIPGNKPGFGASLFSTGPMAPTEVS